MSSAKRAGAQLCATFLVLFSFAQGQQPTAKAGSPAEPNDAQSATTFESRTDLVLVPVVVRDKNGNHVSGLKKDAFHLEENGKEQEISLFEEVKASTAAPSAPPASELNFSNLPFDNMQHQRLIIIVLDLLNTSPLQRADGKDQIVKFLSKGLTQNQPVSLVCLTMKGLELVHPFSTDANVLIEALKKVPPGAERIIPIQESVAQTLRQLREIAHAYNGVPGRKTLIFAAGGIPDPQVEPALYGGFSRSIISMGAFQQTWKNLVDANIAVYPFQVGAWGINPASRRARSTDSTLREFGEATGGNRCVESNGLMSCLGEAVEDSQSYYMLGFTVGPEDRKPGWRDLKVKVAIEHANIRARSGFYYGTIERNGPPPTVRDIEIDALSSPLAYGAVPMYVRVLPPDSPSSGGPMPASSAGKKTVEFLVTIPLSSIKIDATSPNPLDLEVGAIALNQEGKDAGEFTHPLHGTPKPDLLQKLSREGIRLREKLDLPPGTYDVRVMTRDNNAGKIGTVVFPLDVK